MSSWHRMGLEVQVERPKSNTSKLQKLKSERAAVPPRRPTPRERSYHLHEISPGPNSAPAPAILGYYASANNYDEHLSIREQHIRCVELRVEHETNGRAQEGISAVQRVGSQVGASEEVIRAAEQHVSTAMQLARLLDVELAAPWVGGTEGSLGLDWSHRSRRLAVTFDAEGGIEFYATSEEVDRDGRASMVQLLSCIWWLLGGEAPGRP